MGVPDYNVDMTPRLPKYLELADRIRLDILHGALPAGSIAPSENEVAQRYGVSRLTARRTLNELAARGLLKRSRGQRSVVLDRVGPHRPVLYAPGQSDAALEYVPGAAYTVSAFRMEQADEVVAAALGLEVGAQVAFVERRAQVDGKPIMLLRTWLTSRLAAMLEARDFEDRLFVQVFQRANLTIARSREAPLACRWCVCAASATAWPMYRSPSRTAISPPSVTRAKSTSACSRTTELAPAPARCRNGATPPGVGTCLLEVVKLRSAVLSPKRSFVVSQRRHAGLARLLH